MNDATPIDLVLDAFHAAAARADGPALLSHFADDGVFLGTDATERWAGAAFREFVASRFAGGRGWTMSAKRRDVAVRGDVAWFDEDLTHARMGCLRGSGVFVRGADGAWRIAQYNLAVTVPNERFEAVLAAMS
ncbi:MAG: nuclear transport factor 2 family protein [Planctomycetes bacterium]|nr:nuclear transport factor 2 family protein [Planctomycetota bacterium]